MVSDQLVTGRNILKSLGEREAEILLVSLVVVAIVLSIREMLVLDYVESYRGIFIVTSLMVLTVGTIAVLRVLRPDGATTDENVEDDLGDRESTELGPDTDSVALAELDLFHSSTEMTWIFAYVLGWSILGYFTSTILFSFLVIFTKEKSLAVRERFLISAASSVIMVVMTYLIFIYVFETVSIFRLGILP